jgi:MOSC domain-containing protein YiiM
MALRAQNNNMTGWHHRVLVPGYIQPGDEMKLVERINPEWYLSRLQYYMYVERENMEIMRELLELEGLGEETRNIFVSDNRSLLLKHSIKDFTNEYAETSSSKGNIQK